MHINQDQAKFILSQDVNAMDLSQRMTQGQVIIFGWGQVISWAIIQLNKKVINFTFAALA
jgi:tRNA A37 threonylcarbamoyladenosine dehydratase